MQNSLKKMIAAMAAGLMLMPGAALADTISFEGTVSASETCEVYAAIGGTVDSVEVEVGQMVSAGDVLAELETTKVYAEESGVVTGVFGQIGDSADTIAEKYGAVMYIEGESIYTISASTDNAYNETDNKFVHVGETVYLSCYSDDSHTGTGMITSISGTDYTVKVLSGEFLIGETVSVYRGEEANAVDRIGRGELTRTSPTAVTGSGSIVSYAVADGDTVQRGDLLFETLTGEFDGLYMSGNQILAEADGTVAEMNLSKGGRIDKNSIAAVLYPSGAMRIEAQIEEANLSSIAVGDPVVIELIWNQDEEVTYEGTIAMISGIATSSASGASGSVMGGSMESAASDEVTYTVYIDFTPDENTRYGMSAIVSTVDQEEMTGEARSEEEKAIIERDNNAIMVLRKGERIPVPIASLTVLMLGPGTSITHAAMKVIAENGCMVVWCGEGAERFYGYGMGETRSSERLMRQAKCFADPEMHMQVVRRMYALRFEDISTENMTLQQIRGMEGVRVREFYKLYAKKFKVHWNGLNYKEEDWDAADDLNRALSAANACLYGLCNAAVVSLGYSPGLGFVHTGKMMSFVYDVADLYKAETTIPAAFEAVSQPRTDGIETAVRKICRTKMREKRVLKRIADDLAYIFQEEKDDDPNKKEPCALWDEGGSVEGGVNYAEESTW